MGLVLHGCGPAPNAPRICPIVRRINLLLFKALRELLVSCHNF
jgi:hypothetical protein